MLAFSFFTICGQQYFAQYSGVIMLEELTMPTTKHKRKASAHSKLKVVKPPGLLALHPKLFISVGLILVMLGIYLLTFESQDNAMFGLAMISLLIGVVTTIFANFALPKKQRKRS